MYTQLTKEGRELCGMLFTLVRRTIKLGVVVCVVTYGVVAVKNWLNTRPASPAPAVTAVQPPPPQAKVVAAPPRPEPFSIEAVRMIASVRVGGDQVHPNPSKEQPSKVSNRSDTPSRRGQRYSIYEYQWKKESK